jgi:hypothetical protein
MGVTVSRPGNRAANPSKAVKAAGLRGVPPGQEQESGSPIEMGSDWWAMRLYSRTTV